MSAGVAALWMSTMSVGVPAGLASRDLTIDMIGEMPEPPETNRCFAAGWKLVLNRP